MYLAQKAYGQDIAKREAAVLKRLEFGLVSASLRRTFDDLMLEPGVNLSIMQAALVQHETWDDPGKYQTFHYARTKTQRSRKTLLLPTSRRKLSRRSQRNPMAWRLWKAP
jgi:hypothetical protein